MSIEMMIYSAIMMIGNYVLMGLAIYKIATIQKQEKPWLAWIPIGNVYMLIKISKGKMWFLAAPIILFFVAGYQNVITQVITIIATVVFVLTLLYMYKTLCEEYDGSFWMLVVGLFPPIFFINLYGLWKLYKGAVETEKNPNKRKIHSEVRIRKNKKKK
ncbi:hypothetical protein [Clostridium chrysemydis]|uniref:hypothetical protein n=1 Tax=Clostridium chrysemydis TaxID=2665504 RepID=UPI003F36E77E